jgi:hypothetical protein
VVRKVVDHRDASDLGAHLQPPLHALEGGQRRDDRLLADALPEGQGRRRGRIQRVVLASQAHRKLGPQRAAAPNLPAREAVFVPQILNAPIGSLGKSVALDAAEAPATHSVTFGAAVEGDDQPPPRNQVHQPLEGRLHRARSE